MLQKVVFGIFDFVLSVLTSIRIILFGSAEITPIISVKGVLSRLQFFGVVIILLMFNSWVRMLNIEILKYLFGMLSFYCLSAAVQKRCRDFKNSGTFFILCSTVLMLVLYAVYMLESQNVVVSYVKNIVFFTLISLLFLFFIPGKEDKDENLCSPLLKYPRLYAVVCCILAVTATLTVSYYTGTEIKLF